MSAFIIGILISCIAFCFFFKFKSRKSQLSGESLKCQVDKTYQELDLSKMNTENYQTLTLGVGVTARNDSVNEDDSTYTELSQTRNVEANYQTLT